MIRDIVMPLIADGMSTVMEEVRAVKNSPPGISVNPAPAEPIAIHRKIHNHQEPNLPKARYQNKSQITSPNYLALKSCVKRKRTWIHSKLSHKWSCRKGLDQAISNGRHHQICKSHETFYQGRGFCNHLM